jgi:hypothetical protein
MVLYEVREYGCRLLNYVHLEYVIHSATINEFLHNRQCMSSYVVAIHAVHIQYGVYDLILLHG